MTKYTGICICAKRSSGKSWIARKIVEKYPKVFKSIVSFGTGLKESWVHVSGNTMPVTKESKEHWRRYIIKFSDDILKREPHKWCNRFQKDFEKSDGLVICDDCRQDEPVFSPELTTARNLGMIPLRIDCPAQVRRDKFGMLENIEADRHRSEVGLDKHPLWKEHPEYVIHNNGDEQFIKDVDDFVWRYFRNELTKAGYKKGV
jgi:hypothetical protein